MKIEILGTGCPKCEALAMNVAAAVRELGIDAEVAKVTDIVEIANRGVMLTPALSVDGEIKLVGKVATVGELKALLG
jgi:small redox-active disulfide protein 2